jgi:hypothetical protein
MIRAVRSMFGVENLWFYLVRRGFVPRSRLPVGAPSYSESHHSVVAETVINGAA